VGNSSGNEAERSVKKGANPLAAEKSCQARKDAAALKTCAARVYEVRPRKDKRGVDLIWDVLPFGRLWYSGASAAENAIGYAKFFSRSHDAVIRVYDETANVIETHEQADEFKEW
jgi:hypothetical protein